MGSLMSVVAGGFHCILRLYLFTINKDIWDCLNVAPRTQYKFRDAVHNLPQTRTDGRGSSQDFSRVRLGTKFNSCRCHGEFRP